MNFKPLSSHYVLAFFLLAAGSMTKVRGSTFADAEVCSKAQFINEFNGTVYATNGFKNSKKIHTVTIPVDGYYDIEVTGSGSQKPCGTIFIKPQSARYEIGYPTTTSASSLIDWRKLDYPLLKGQVMDFYASRAGCSSGYPVFDVDLKVSCKGLLEAEEDTPRIQPVEVLPLRTARKEFCGVRSTTYKTGSECSLQSVEEYQCGKQPKLGESNLCPGGRQAETKNVSVSYPEWNAIKDNPAQRDNLCARLAGDYFKYQNIITLPEQKIRNGDVGGGISDLLGTPGTVSCVQSEVIKSCRLAIFGEEDKLCQRNVYDEPCGIKSIIYKQCSYYKEPSELVGYLDGINTVLPKLIEVVLSERVNQADYLNDPDALYCLIDQYSKPEYFDYSDLIFDFKFKFKDIVGISFDEYTPAKKCPSNDLDNVGDEAVVSTSPNQEVEEICLDEPNNPICKSNDLIESAIDEIMVINENLTKIKENILKNDKDHMFYDADLILEFEQIENEIEKLGAK